MYTLNFQIEGNYMPVYIIMKFHGTEVNRLHTREMVSGAGLICYQKYASRDKKYDISKVTINYSMKGSCY